MDFSFLIRKRQGSLMQTLVMCIIMASISVMIMKWIMMRYTMSVRLQRSVQSKARAEALFNYNMSTWSSSPVAFTLPPTGQIDGKNISGFVTPNFAIGGGLTTNRITLSMDEDQ